MSEYDLYLLIHPERWPTNESGVIAGPNLDAEVSLTAPEAPDFDHAYGAEVSRVMATATRAIVVLDQYGIEGALADLDADPSEDFDDIFDRLRAGGNRGCEVICGGPRIGEFHRFVEADALDIGRVVGNRVGLREDRGSVLLGGFNRYDCIRRSAAALERLEWDVTICPTTALPLEVAGVEHYLCAARP